MIRRLGRLRSVASRTGMLYARSQSHLSATASARRPSSSVFRVSEEVQDALATGKPVVALETAIVTHGMPEPHHLDVAHTVEGRIRAEGAIPATIGLLDGKVVVGLSAQELKVLAAASRERTARKVSRRDLAVAIAERAVGGTTVATTMMAAHWAGIGVFVTGGIGGVHRGGESSLDVSADLTELGRTPVTVVCAGCKSILDIGRTLEYLETQGVPTLTLGSQNNFPAFFAPDSGFTASHTVSTPRRCAEIIHASLQLGVQNGLVVGVPIPSDEGKAVESAIQQALEEASEADVAGRDVTPLVLRRVNELSAGKSLAANIELIKNNATVGSQIAAEVAKLAQTPSSSSPDTSTHGASPSSHDSMHSHSHSSSASSHGGFGSSLSSSTAHATPTSFASPSPHVPVFLGQQHTAADEPATLGNTPPVEYVRASRGEASSIDQELTAEFEQLIPRDLRPAAEGSGSGAFPPPGFIRRYHTSASRWNTSTAQASHDAQLEQDLLDFSHLADRHGDYLLATSSRHPVVVGAMVVDVVAKPTDDDIQLHLTNNCTVSTSFGGVGRNVFEAMVRCGQRPLMISAVGAKQSQNSPVQDLHELLNDQQWCTVGIRPCAGHTTATYMAVLQNNGDLFTGIGNFDVVERITPCWLHRFEKAFTSAPIVVVDSNLSGDAMSYVLSTCAKHNVPVWYEPTCTAKAAKIYSTSEWQSIAMTSPNLVEMQTMARACLERSPRDIARETVGALERDVQALSSPEQKVAVCLELGKILLDHHPCLLVTLDKDGVALLRRQYVDDDGDRSESLRDCLVRYAGPADDDSAAWRISCRLYNLPDPVDASTIVSVSGAGDSMVGGIISAMLSDSELTVNDSMLLGLRAARTSLPVAEAISPALSLDTLKE